MLVKVHVSQSLSHSQSHSPSRSMSQSIVVFSLVSLQQV